MPQKRRCGPYTEVCASTTVHGDTMRSDRTLRSSRSGPKNLRAWATRVGSAPNSGSVALISTVMAGIWLRISACHRVVLASSPAVGSSKSRTSPTAPLWPDLRRSSSSPIAEAGSHTKTTGWTSQASRSLKLWDTRSGPKGGVGSFAFLGLLW